MNTPTSPRLIYASTALEVESGVASHNLRRMITSSIVNERFVPVARVGQAPNPWNLQIDALASMPETHSSQGATWDEVTDQRALSLAHTLAQDDREIFVYWSGGIDSTAIVTAMIKNWGPDLLARVCVIMNNGSYFENPWFFNRIIKTRFKFMSTPVKDWRQCWVINGYAADQTWVQADVISIDRWRPGSVRRNPLTQRDDLLTWLAFKSDLDHANWVIDLVLANAESAGIDIIDYEDFFWWLNFNFVFSGQLFKGYGFINDTVYLSEYLPMYRHSAISWYASTEYQLWSMQNRSNGVKYQDTVRSYKMPAKQYIYDLDRNAWYRDYKTKMGSSKLVMPNKIEAIYDDGTVTLADTACKNHLLRL